MNPAVGAIFDILIIVTDLLIWAVVIGTLLSLLISFNAVNPRNEVVSFLWRSYTALSEPVLKPIRRVVKPINGIDLSPLVLVLALTFLRQLLIRAL